MDETEVTPMEVLAPSAVHALEKAAIDVQVSTAHAYPRSIEKFRKRALDMATLDEETAESCIYCREVGKELNKKTGVWEPKFAEGPSIRLAEIVGCSYGNLRVASRIVEQTPRYVKCEGVCHDLESNYAGKSEIMEATVTKNGDPYSERQRALTAKVALAKAYRDAIFKVVPRALCKQVIEAAKKTATGASKPLEERRKKVQAWVSTLKVSEERVFAAIGVTGWAEVGNEQLLILTGLKTALGDGERIDEVFPPIENAQDKTPDMPGKRAKKDKEPAKTEAPKEPEPPKEQPPKEEPPKVTEPEKPAETPEQAEERELAEAGLAPVKEPEPAKTEDPYVEDPKLAARAGETDALASVKLLARQSKVTHSQIMAWAVSAKIASAEQSLSDLSEKKLTRMQSQWAGILPAITKFAK